MNKFITLFVFISLFQNGIAQEEEKISTYEYFKSGGKSVYNVNDAKEIVGYIYMDKTFTKVKKYSNYFKLISKRKDGSKIFEGKMDCGYWTGEWIYFHPNGKPLFKGYYLNGIVQNQFAVYYPDGNPKEIIEYNNGEMKVSCELKETGDTTLIVFYDKGEPIFLKRYRDDKIDERTFKSYIGKNCDVLIKNVQGNVLMSGHYYNQFAVGKWTFFDEKGATIKQFLFNLKDSVIISDDILYNSYNGSDSNSKQKINENTIEKNIINDNSIRFVSEDFLYPNYSKYHNIGGRIFIRIEISETGEMEYIIPLNIGPQGELTNTAIRIVQYVPKPKSSIDRDKPKRVQYTFPINFQIQD